MTHHVEVNECRALATQRGADWWIHFRNYYERMGRIRVITASIGGDLVAVACDDQDHATWLRDLVIRQGVSESAVKVRRGDTRLTREAPR